MKIECQLPSWMSPVQSRSPAPTLHAATFAAIDATNTRAALLSAALVLAHDDLPGNLYFVLAVCIFWSVDSVWFSSASASGM